MRGQSRHWFSADGLACLLLLTSVCLVYLPELLGWRAFFYLDIATLNLPARSWGVQQMWRDGYWPTVPHWCPNWYTGFPYVAESQNGIYYPFNILFYSVFPAWYAYNLNYLLHLAIGGIGYYFLLSRITGSLGGSFVGALSLTLGGRMLTHHPHTSIPEVLAWFPWVLLGLWYHAWRTYGPATTSQSNPAQRMISNSLLWTGLAAGLQVWAGSLQALVWCQVGYIFWMLGLWVFLPCDVSLPTKHYRNWRRHFIFCSGWLQMLGWLVGLGLVLLLPTWELLQVSRRAGGISSAEANWAVAIPAYWFTFAAPDWFGREGTATSWLDARLPWREMVSYQGLLVVPLAALGMTFGRPRPQVGLWLSFTLIGLLLSLGEATWLGRFFRQLPVLESLRNPIRYLLLTNVGLAGLAALGWQACVMRHPNHGWRYCGVWWLVGVLLLSAGSWIAFQAYGDLLLWREVSESQPIWIFQQVRQSNFWQQMSGQLQQDVGMLIIGLTIGWLAVWCARQRPQLTLSILTLFLVCDVGWHARQRYPSIDPSFYVAPAAVDYLLHQLPSKLDDPGRILLENPPTALRDTAFEHSQTAYWQTRDCLSWERGVLYDLNAIALNARLPLELAAWQDWQRAFQTKPEQIPAYLGCNWLMRPMPIEANTATAAQWKSTSVGSFGQCYLYNSQKPNLLAYFTSQVQRVPKNRMVDVIAQMTDYTSAVLLESEQQTNNPTDPFATSTISDPYQPIESIRRPSSDQIIIELTAPTAGWVVLRETFYPGWTVTLDDHTKLLPERANLLFQAIAVPAGKHRLVWQFRSLPVVWGKWGTLITLGLWGSLIIWNGRSSKSLTQIPPSEVTINAAEAKLTRSPIQIIYLLIWLLSLAVYYYQYLVVGSNRLPSVLEILAPFMS